MAHGGIDKRANLKTAEHYNHMNEERDNLIAFAMSDIGLTEDEAEYEADLFLSLCDNE